MTHSNLRELAHRANHGVEITLLWSQRQNRITVEVFDARFDDGFAFEVAPAHALDAFRHPYAYAPSHLVRSLTTAPAALAA